jgi:hypothetical protein
MKALILAVLLLYPSYYLERTTEQADARRARLAELAEAIDQVNATPGEIAAVMALAWLESRLARYVHVGDCAHPPKGAPSCDRGRARSPWQLHRAGCPALWELEQGSPEWLRAGAQCAANRWRYGLALCGSAAGAYAVYRGRACSWAGGPAGAEAVRDVQRRLR